MGKWVGRWIHKIAAAPLHLTIPHPTLTPPSPHSHPTLSHITSRIGYGTTVSATSSRASLAIGTTCVTSALQRGYLARYVRTFHKKNYISSAQLLVTMPDSNPNSKPEAEARSASLDLGLAPLTHLSTHPTSSHPTDPRAYATCCTTSNSIISHGGRLRL